MLLTTGRTTPGLEVVMDPSRDGYVILGEAHISPEDMVALTSYWLTGADLTGPSDLRLKFVAFVKAMTVVTDDRLDEVDGVDGESKRLLCPYNPLDENAPSFPYEKEVGKSVNPYEPDATAERPIFAGQILDPSTLRPGMKIGVHAVTNRGIWRKVKTIAFLDLGMIGFDEDRYGPDSFRAGYPHLFRQCDFGLVPYQEGGWHPCNYCFTVDQ